MIRTLLAKHNFMLCWLFTIYFIANSKADVATAREWDNAPTILSGSVIDQTGNPVPDAKVLIRSNMGDETLAATSDDRGQFKLSAPSRPNDLSGLMIRAESADGSQVGFCQRLQTGLLGSDYKIRIQLTPKKVIQVRIVDVMKAPIAGATAFVELESSHILGPFITNADGLIKADLSGISKIKRVVAFQHGKGLAVKTYQRPMGMIDAEHKPATFAYDGIEVIELGGVTPVHVHVVDDQNRPLPDASVRIRILTRLKDLELFMPQSYGKYLEFQTDQNGDAVIDWFPKWHITAIVIDASHEGYVANSVLSDSESPAPKVDLKLERETILQGRVAYPDGKPASKKRVFAHSYQGSPPSTASATTDEEGRYKIAIAPNRDYKVYVDSDKWFALQSGVNVTAFPNATECNLQLRKTIRIYGAVIDATNGKPASNVSLHLLLKEKNRLVDSYLLQDTDGLISPIHTDPQGNYQFNVCAGEYVIVAPNMSNALLAVLDDQQDTKLDLSLNPPPLMELVGKVVDSQGLPAAQATIFIISPDTLISRGSRGQADQNGSFKIERSKDNTLVQAQSADKQSGSLVKLSPEDSTTELRLAPYGTVTGRLMSHDGSAPNTRADVHVGIKAGDTEHLSCARRVPLDENGNFEIVRLESQMEYTMAIHRFGEDSKEPVITKFKLEPGQTLELGEVRMPNREATHK